jgi:hypothetical protein
MLSVKKIGTIINNVLGSIYIVILYTLLLGLIYLNIRLYYRPTVDAVGNDLINKDLLLEARSLREQMDNRIDIQMQQIYPEGYVFMNALYGLTWVELARTSSIDAEIHREAVQEVQRAFDNIDSDLGKNPFEKSLPIPYGAFYGGWKHYLLGAKISVETISRANPSELKMYLKHCEHVASILKDSTMLYSPSYKGGIWPADFLINVATLAQHDQLFKPKYELTIQQWVARVQKNLDKYGLIPHHVKNTKGSVAESARGSSQSLMLPFLMEIDRAFALQQFERYSALFKDVRIGIPVILEYAKGSSGEGDIDSGPIWLGAGASATIAGMRTLKVYNDRMSYLGIRNAVEAFGFAQSIFGQKKYLFGKMPMADVFIAWGHAQDSLLEGEVIRDAPWRNKFFIYSILPAVLLILLITRYHGIMYSKT